MSHARSLLLAAVALAILGTLADTGGEASATSHSQSDRGLARHAAAPSIDHDQVAVYLANKSLIDEHWIQAGDECTLAQAIELWSNELHGPPPKATTVAHRAPQCESGTCGPAARPDYTPRVTRARDRRFGWRLRRAFGRR
jgi:hypothetical protein